MLNSNSMYCFAPCSSSSPSLFRFPSIPMMLGVFCFLLSVTLSPAASSDLLSSSADAQLLQLCARFPGLEVCQPSDEVLSSGMAKRKSAYMRFGRANAADAAADELEMEKRKSAYMRFGKRSPDEGGEPYQIWVPNESDAQQMEKRKSAYMRFGKRKSAYMRFGRK